MIVLLIVMVVVEMMVMKIICKIETFRLRVRLTVLSKGSQEIWGLTNPSLIPL